MKKTEIGARVFEVMDHRSASPLVGGPLVVPVADLGGLSMVPWFSDPSVQWAIRLAQPGSRLAKKLVGKVAGAYPALTEDGAVLIGVPGDGISPPMPVLFPLAEALAAAAAPGMVLELASANLGTVKRDREVKAETSTEFGHQLYRGVVEADRRWAITATVPALPVGPLAAAIGCGRLVVSNGPWNVRDRDEARAILLHWMRSPEANINPLAVQRFYALRDGAFVTEDEGMIQRRYGLALGFFRERLAGGPFPWSEKRQVMFPDSQLEEIASSIVG